MQTMTLFLRLYIVTHTAAHGRWAAMSGARTAQGGFGALLQGTLAVPQEVKWHLFSCHWSLSQVSVVLGFHCVLLWNQ